MAFTSASPVLTATSNRTSLFREISIVVGASIVIGLFARFSIHLPFSPVPIALQSHVILLMAALLGSKRIVLVVSAFLLEGLMGFPVFASGNIGPFAFLAPTGGYLIGYLLAAFATGLMFERLKNKTVKSSLLALGAGNVLIYFCGVPWLAIFVGYKSAFLFGLLPFILGDCIKLILSIQGIKAFSR